MSNLFKCGLCDFLFGLLRRVMCVRNRRGSSDSCYREIGGQNTVRMDSTPSSDTASEQTDLISTPTLSSFPGAVISSRRTFEEELAKILEENVTLCPTSRTHFGDFCTIKRQGPSYSGSKELDDCYPKLTELLLSKAEMWEFDTFLLDRATGGHCLQALGMDLFNKYELIKHFQLNRDHCRELFMLIEMNYHGNPYHNAVHATDVTQALHCFLQQPAILDHLRKTEILAVLLAALTHDLDHPGFGKSFLVASQHPLAVMYKDHEMGKNDRSPLLQQRKAKFLQLFRRDGQDDTEKRATSKGSGASSSKSFFRRKKKQVEGSILECHHWRVAYSCILQSKIFDHMSTRLPYIKRLLKELILATDISRQEDYLKAFKPLLTHKNLDMRLAEHRLMVLQIALKTADISNPGRPWRISRKWSLLVCDEFFNQGDEERRKNIPISYLCNREQDSIPYIQTGFIKFIAKPLYTQWHRYSRSEVSLKMMTNLVRNAALWNREAQRSKTDINKITPTDQKPPSLSRNHSASTECMLQAAGGRAPRVAPRRSSYSPARASTVKDALRRFSAPLQALVGAPRVISEVVLRQELHPGWRPPPTDDYNPSARKTPRRSAEEIHRSRTLSRLELAIAVAADRSRSQERRSSLSQERRGSRSQERRGSRSQERRGSRSQERRGSRSQERPDSTRPSPHRPAAPTPTRASMPPPVPEYGLNSSPRSCGAFSSQDGDSTNGLDKFRFDAFVLAECGLDSLETTSPSMTTSTDPHMLSTVTGSLSTPSSDIRFFFPSKLDSESSCATGSCEAVVQHAVSREECCEVLARLIPELKHRRGSAPVVATPMPRLQSTHAESRKLSASYATCQRIAEAVPPVRRGSLPVEVMTGISAL